VIWDYIFGRGKIYHFCKTPRPTVWPIQLPTQCRPQPLSLWQSRWDIKLTIHLHLVWPRSSLYGCVDYVMMVVHLGGRCSSRYYEHLILRGVGHDSVVGTATHYELYGLGIKSQWRQYFWHLSRLALGPTKSPIQWV